MIKSTFDLENKLISEGYDFVIGIDEAGRGPLAGPVVAVSVRQREILNSESKTNSKFLDLIRDSKTLSHKQRESLFDFIHKHFFVGVGICDHQTIDRMNILEASFLAMKAALSDLKSKIKNEKSKLQIKIQNDIKNTKCQIQDIRYIILLDGNKHIPNISYEQRVIVNGDKIVKSISAASIIAKVTRDRIMMEMHAKYPEYNFAQHKGYGTRAHILAIKKHGLCPIHRRSFRPCQAVIALEK